MWFSKARLLRRREERNIPAKVRKGFSDELRRSLACEHDGFHDREPGDRGRVRDRVRRQPEVIVNWFAELATSMS